MSLISDLLKKLFGRGSQPEAAVTSSKSFSENQWERERAERNSNIEQSAEEWLVKYLDKKASVDFTWESGNDEAFVYFSDMPDADEDDLMDVESYIIIKLNIPDAGEFEMNGAGTIYKQDNNVRVKYSSIIKALIDFNEDTEEEIYSEEEKDSGDVILFAI